MESKKKIGKTYTTEEMLIKNNPIARNFVYNQNTIEKCLITMKKVFLIGFGKDRDYHGNHYYNPVKAGMEIQQIKENFDTIVNLLGYNFNPSDFIENKLIEKRFE